MRRTREGGRDGGRGPEVCVWVGSSPEIESERGPTRTECHVEASVFQSQSFLSYIRS